MSYIDADFDPKRRLVATLGRFTVYYDPLVHLPWGLYRVYAGQKYIGAQISFPCKSDCEFLLHRSTPVLLSSHNREYRERWLRGATSAGFLLWRKEKRAA